MHSIQGCLDKGKNVENTYIIISIYIYFDESIYLMILAHHIKAGGICFRGRLIAVQRQTPLYASTFLDDSNREEMLEGVWVSSPMPQYFTSKS